MSFEYSIYRLSVESSSRLSTTMSSQDNRQDVLECTITENHAIYSMVQGCLIKRAEKLVE